MKIEMLKCGFLQHQYHHPDDEKPAQGEMLYSYLILVYNDTFENTEYKI